MCKIGCSPRVLALATLALAASASAFAPGYAVQELAPLRQPARRLGNPTRHQRLSTSTRGATAVKALAVPDGCDSCLTVIDQFSFPTSVLVMLRTDNRMAVWHPIRYGAVMATAAFSAGMVQWAAINVAIARKKYGIKYPKMYEGTDDSVFDCVQRAHQNTLEYLPSFLSLLMLNGIAAPYSTAVVGMVLSCSFVLILHSRAAGPGQAATGGDMEECLQVWNVARIIYVVGYG